MKKAPCLVTLALAALPLALAARASNAPLVDAHLVPLTSAKALHDEDGPLTMSFQLTLTNRSVDALTLTRVEVRADDTAGFVQTDGARDVHVGLAPSATEAVELTALGIAPEDFVNGHEVKVHVLLTFEGPNGAFLKEFQGFVR